MKGKSKKRRIRVKKDSLLRKIVLVFILLLVVLNILRYAAYFKKEDDSEMKISIQNDVNIELAHDVYIDENNVIYLSEDDMREYFDKELYYEKNDSNMRRYISVCQNKVLEITESENHIFVNGAREKIKGAIIERDGVFYFPISELQNVYNIEIDYLEDKNRLNIEKLSEEKVVAVVNRSTNLKYKMTWLSKNVERLQQGETVTIVQKMDNSWVKVKTSDYDVGYIKSSKLINEEKERYDLGKADYSEFDVEKATLIEINDSTYVNFDELIDKYDTRREVSKEILQQVIEEISKLEGKDVGVRVNMTSVQNVEDYYRFLKELRANVNDVGVCLLVVNQPNLDENILKDVVNIVL